MKLEITRLEVRRNDLLLRLERAELDSALLSVANREALRVAGDGRHRPATDEEQGGSPGSRCRSRHISRHAIPVGGQ